MNIPMKSSLFLTLASLSLAASLHAQSGAARTPPPLGLLRLKSETKPNEAAPVASITAASSGRAWRSVGSIGTVCSSRLE